MRFGLQHLVGNVAVGEVAVAVAAEAQAVGPADAWVAQQSAHLPTGRNHGHALVLYVGDVNVLVLVYAYAVAEWFGGHILYLRGQGRGRECRVGAGGHGHAVEAVVAHGGVIYVAARGVHVQAIDAGHEVY